MAARRSPSGTSSTQSAGSLRPAKAHFDSLRKQRNENASGREKIIDAMAALGDEAAAPSPRGKTRLARSGKAQVSPLRPMEERRWCRQRRVEGAGRNSMSPSKTRQRPRWREPEIARRKRLIAQAEELAKATPSRETTDATITLQRRWAAERPRTCHICAARTSRSCGTTSKAHRCRVQGA